jgi:hypothetical protein
MPHVIWAWCFPAQAAGIVRAEFHRPASDRLIGNDDAALQQLFDHAQAQRKAEVEPNSVGNYIRQETMAFIADWVPDYGAS